MVIKGQSVAGARRLAIHLQRTDTNERAELLDLRGTVAAELEGGLKEVEAVASGTRCSKPFYHASINTRADERLTDLQRWQAIDRLERELGLAGQPRAVMLHEKEGREHCHIVWSRIDLDRMAAISDSHNYRKHELVARELERDFGHARVQGAHIERDGPRPERTPSHAEMQMGARGGVMPDDARALVTEIWRRTDNGASFRQGLEEQGWLLARGDRRDFVALDPAGCVHSLARRIEGANAKEVRERLGDLDRDRLPSVLEARQALRERRAEHRQETPVPPQPRRKARQEIARNQASPTPPANGFAPVKGVLMMADSLGRGAEKLTDFVAGLAESLGGGTPQRQHSAAELARDPAARRAAYAEQAAARRSDAALDRKSSIARFTSPFFSSVSARS